MTVIDINIDAGESYGAWSMGDDAGTFPYATSVNLACGFHGGDPASMFAAARLALRARPRDRRAPGTARPRRLRTARGCTSRPTRPTTTSSTRWARSRACSACSAATLHHVKLHGAFSTHVGRGSRPSPTACCAPCTTSIPTLPLIVTPGSQLERAAARRSAIRASREAFPERGYAPDGLLAGAAPRAPSSPTWTRPRAAPCAWRSRARWTRSTARRSSFRPRTLCIHGDNPHAARIAAAVRAALEAAGVELAAF